ncbi:DEAD/DEAH box helicase [Candidatus Pacearchaeota archaeon]|nr:DEAD/DEAH box helicase [Candidatus Pacearchaeota archaeon]
MISGIHLHEDLKKAFLELGFSEMTEIQQKTIPLIQHGKDVIAQSKTGSGKTAAFGFPMLEKISPHKGLQALVLVPTRELCEQVMTELRKFAKYKRMNIIAVYGVVSINPQIFAIRNADIVVGTPGRMLDHLQRGTINLSKVQMLVLDEADKMFEMGFIDDVKQIISQTPKERQTLLFSATISTQVHEIVQHYMRHPEKIKVQSYVEEAMLEQFYYDVPSREKFSLLVHLLKKENAGLVIIFCATRSRVNVVAKNIYKNGFQAEPLHGGLSQNQRKRAIDAFHANKVDILVASDVAARGLDIKNVNLIVNYDIPKTSKEYIHRIGRTARAGTTGKVISLLSHEDHENFRNVMDDRSLVIQKVELPQFERIAFFSAGRQDGDRPRYDRPQRGGYGHQRSHGHSYRGPQRRSFGSERGEQSEGRSYGGRSQSSGGYRPRYGHGGSRHHFGGSSYHGRR